MNAKERVNILLVDDQPAKLLSYEAILADLGENLIKATSGREALDVLLHTDVTIVLMDVSMPELDGFQLAELIHSHPRFQRTAIIFVSAVHLTENDRLRGYETGAVDYVSVPVVPEILRAKVRAFAELHRQRMEVERLNRELEERVQQRTAELQASTARLQASEEKLREADRRKDEFLALLAHELRNPLAPVRNAVQIMRLKTTDDAELNWCRQIIERQVDQLARLVDDLLDVSRITRGKIRLYREPVDLAAVIAEAVETSRPLIDSRRHQLDVTMPDVAVHVDGDPARLTQMVANLLNNAAKYQDEGGRITLHAQLAGGEVIIRVRDWGVGIARERLNTVFDLFAQGETALDRANGGLGIGLWLVRNLAELHGGSVQAASDGPGQGCEFTVRLPCDTSARRNCPQEPDAPELQAPQTPMRILVVDDNPDVAESLSYLLRFKGHDVFVAHDGPTALDLAAARQPEAIFLDIGMPGMDGFEVCRRLRAQGQRDTFIVALTGYGQDRDRQRSIDAGFDTHAVKPVDLSELLKLLATRGDPVTNGQHGPRH